MHKPCQLLAVCEFSFDAAPEHGKSALLLVLHANLSGGYCWVVPWFVPTGVRAEAHGCRNVTIFVILRR